MGRKGYEVLHYLRIREPSFSHYTGRRGCYPCHALYTILKARRLILLSAGRPGTSSSPTDTGGTLCHILQTSLGGLSLDLRRMYGYAGPNAGTGLHPEHGLHWQRCGLGSGRTGHRLLLYGNEVDWRGEG